MDDAESLSAADVTALQRQVGNSAAQGSLARRNGAGSGDLPAAARA
jgi:hypothetical protein